MPLPSRNDERNGKLRLTINNEVEFIAIKGKLFRFSPPACAFHRVFIRITSGIAPCQKMRCINREIFSINDVAGVAFLYQLNKNRRQFFFGECPHKPA